MLEQRELLTPNIWPRSKHVWFRSWGLQQGQYQKTQETEGKACWCSTNRNRGLGCVRDQGKTYKARAGPSGRVYWNHKERQIWIQQTGCKKHRGDGLLWPSCNFRFQHEQIGKNGWSGIEVRKKKSDKGNEERQKASASRRNHKLLV